MASSSVHSVYGKAFAKLLDVALKDDNVDTIDALLWAINTNGRFWAKAMVREEASDPVDLFDDLVEHEDPELGW